MAMTIKILNIAWVYKFREQLLFTYSCLLVHTNTAFKFTCDERHGLEENTNVGWSMVISAWEDEYIDIVCVILFLCNFSKSRDWNLWLRWWVNVIRHVLNHCPYAIWLYLPCLNGWSLVSSICTLDDVTHTYTWCAHPYIISLWRKPPCDVIQVILPR